MNLRDQFIKEKKHKKRWTLLTAYDAPTAELLEAGGIDMILVGDSLGMVLLGYPSTIPVTMDEMIHHAKAVRRGAPKSFIIGDLPLKGVERGPKQALESARRFIEEARLDAVKLEWGPHAIKTSGLFLKHRLPLMGHVGLTPQTAKKNTVQGTEAARALKIYRDAASFEQNGAFSVLLECIPSAVTKLITKNLKVPTIGIGAGPDCDGQVLVFQDLVGIFKKFKPRFVKRYANLDAPMRRAVESYKREVMTGKFPQAKQSYSIQKEEFDAFLEGLK